MQAQIAVIGDVLLDVSLYGSAGRPSPEIQDMQIVTGERLDYNLGGAGNVAEILARAGASVTLWGSVGEDIWGERARLVCDRAGIDHHLSVAGPQTTLKLRFYGGRRQLARGDVELVSPAFIPHAVPPPLALGEAHVVILSNYNKGVFLGKRNADAVRAIIDAVPCPILVDTKPMGAITMFSGAWAMTPNEAEAQGIAQALGVQGDTPAAYAPEIRAHLDLYCLIVTMGPNGVWLSARHTNRDVTPDEAVASGDAQIVGAGDALTAGLALALIAAEGKHLGRCCRWLARRACNFAQDYVSMPRSRDYTSHLRTGSRAGQPV